MEDFFAGEGLTQKSIQKICPIRTMLVVDYVKHGARVLPQPSADVNCVSTCEGARYEQRKLGNVNLPRLFDRILCGEVELQAEQLHD